MSKKQTPNQLCDYVLDWLSETSIFINNYSRSPNQCTSLEIIIVYTPHISEYLDFVPNDYTMFKSNTVMLPTKVGI